MPDHGKHCSLFPYQTKYAEGLMLTIFVSTNFSLLLALLIHNYITCIHYIIKLYLNYWPNIKVPLHLPFVAGIILTNAGTDTVDLAGLYHYSTYYQLRKPWSIVWITIWIAFLQILHIIQIEQRVAVKLCSRNDTIAHHYGVNWKMLLVALKLPKYY